MAENKEKIVMLLEVLLKQTRAGKGIECLQLNEEQDEVTIIFDSGFCRKVNIAADSGVAIIRDVLYSL